MGKRTLFKTLMRMKIHTSQGNLEICEKCIFCFQKCILKKYVCKKSAITVLQKMSKKRIDYVHYGIGITVKTVIKDDVVEAYLLT